MVDFFSSQSTEERQIELDEYVRRKLLCESVMWLDKIDAKVYISKEMIDRLSCASVDVRKTVNSAKTCC